MKNLLLLLTFSFGFLTLTAQEFADFKITATNEGLGTFTNAVLPNFTWVATGTINGNVQILNDEVFDDGNAFENTFGQADYAENLRTQIYPNGDGSIGNPILSQSKLTISFDQITPADGWGFCIVDIDVENCLISAIDENDNDIAVEVINDWLIEPFDANLTEYGVNLPKWDATHAALLGSDTPEDYVVYNNLVIGGLEDNEAAAAYFMPNIPLKTLIIDYENLQDIYFVSFHFYIASMKPTGTKENENIQLSVHPNPASSVVSLKSAVFNQHLALIEILDLTGQTLLKKNIPAGMENVEIDVTSLKSGVYYVKLQTVNKTVTKKLIIQK